MRIVFSEDYQSRNNNPDYCKDKGLFNENVQYYKS